MSAIGLSDFEIVREPTRRSYARDGAGRTFRLRFPVGADELPRNEEWIEVELDGRWQRIRMHDHVSLFDVPGLYETLVYEKLECRSPAQVTALLGASLDRRGEAPGHLRVLDFGAGNGVMGAHLRELGVRHLIGVDVIPEALAAVERDRPEAYDDYVICDLASPTPQVLDALRAARCNCLSTVAALGSVDASPKAFAVAFNAIATPGWVAMSIRECFLEATDQSGFSQLVRVMIGNGLLEVEAQKSFRHRRSLNGEELTCMALVGRKRRDIPAHLLDRASRHS